MEKSSPLKTIRRRVRPSPLNFGVILMKMIWRFCLAIFLILPVASYAIEPFNCRNGAFPTYTELGLGEIAAKEGEQVHAREDGEGCPEQEKCLRKGYLVKGDKVVTAHPAEGWICIYYFGNNDDYTGWLPQANVKALPFSTSPNLKEWVGRWEDIVGVNKVIIQPASAGKLKVSGKAFWHGGQNGDGEQIVHYGQVNGLATPVANHLTIKEGDDEFSCVVNFQLLGSYLIATDNGNCGGMNVRFDDVYRRKPTSHSTRRH